MGSSQMSAHVSSLSKIPRACHNCVKTNCFIKNVSQRGGNPPPLLVAVYAGAATAEDRMQVLQKTKTRATTRTSNPTPGRIQRRMPLYAHSSSMYHSQDTGTTYMSTDRQRDEDVVRIRNGILRRTNQCHEQRRGCNQSLSYEVKCVRMRKTSTILS